MKVKDLIKELQKIPPNTVVVSPLHAAMSMGNEEYLPIGNPTLLKITRTGHCTKAKSGKTVLMIEPQL